MSATTTEKPPPMRATRIGESIGSRGDLRDDDRRRILEGELAKEEARLAELRREDNHGEPERHGSERNYQKYLDRVQRLKDDIARAEANLVTLRRELGGGRP